jgi:hypothetical protein
MGVVEYAVLLEFACPGQAALRTQFTAEALQSFLSRMVQLRGENLKKVVE